VTAKPYTPLTMTQECEKAGRSIKHWRLPGGETVIALWNALMRSFAELDATRATLAEVTRERDEAALQHECVEVHLARTRAGLAAAQLVSLGKEAYEDAAMHLNAVTVADAARTPSSTDALREFGVRVARKAWDSGHDGGSANILGSAADTQRDADAVEIVDAEIGRAGSGGTT
jgi:hypothetical protein